MNNSKIMESLKAQAVSLYPNPKGGEVVVSDICVLQSNAGYYYGTLCVEHMFDQWFPQPYERISQYYATAEIAEQQMLLELAA